ncbi:MAG: 3-phosphoshikimate 1-carboxyvinyltransferase [Rhodothermales bacterium]
MKQVVAHAQAFVGVPELPPDKSIAHRAAMISAISDGVSRIVNYPSSADPQSTLSCLRQLGVSVTFEETGDDGGIMVVQGVGLRGLKAPSRQLDCGNSGTTMRLLSGILAGQGFESKLVGDDSLSSRPMERIAEPLRRLGASVSTTDGHAPIVIGGGKLHGVHFETPVRSAQVKSAILLAGLYADGETSVTEAAPTRDHTERMLGLSAIQIGGQRVINVQPIKRIPSRTWTVPSDFSAAAFFIVAATVLENAKSIMMGVGLNPTRSALLDVLKAMGAKIGISNERERGGEPIADLQIESAALSGVVIDEALIPNLIDELPILAVAATQAEGRTLVRGAGDLRNKESDRIDAVCVNLRALGASVEEFDDGFAITGPTKLTGTTVSSYHDHRIAMSMGVAGLIASGETTVENSECVAISFPGFWDELEKMSIA